LADATSAFIDPEPVTAARAGIEAADIIIKPVMMATEAVVRIFIVTPFENPLCSRPDYFMQVRRTEC
jgi:hypothetical protein